MHNMIPLACPILFHLKLMRDDESVGGAEVGQNIKVGVLGGQMSQCALFRLDMSDKARYVRS